MAKGGIFILSNMNQKKFLHLQAGRKKLHHLC